MNSLPVIPRRLRAFSLIELLVVIAVIALLAAMIFPAAHMVKAKATRNKARGELDKIVSAIEEYKNKYGHYPPDNPTNAVMHQLYYELLGTRESGGTYTTLSGGEQITAAGIGAVVGAGGLINASHPGAGDEVSGPKAFLNDLKSDQLGPVTAGGGRFVLLCTSVPWPTSQPSPFPGGVTPARPDLNPVYYNLSTRTNNPKSYDLWVNVRVGSRTERINNWGDPERSN